MNSRVSAVVPLNLSFTLKYLPCFTYMEARILFKGETSGLGSL